LLLALFGVIFVFGLGEPAAYARKPAAAAAKKAHAARKPAAKTDDDKRAEARKAYAEGEAKVEAGDYAAAYAAYKAANDLIPASITLFKMALCLDKQNKTAEALVAYEDFLSSNPPEKMRDKVSESKARVAALKKSTESYATTFVTRPPGAVVAVDGVQQTGTTPLEISLSPGRHRIGFAPPGAGRFVKEIILDADSAQTIEIGLFN
jgi:tetratricopeptide (TPR) repeat protein